MMLLKNTLIAFTAAAVLVACESNSNFDAKTNTKEVTSKKVVKHFTGKAAAAVDMDYVIEKNIIAGDETEIKITFTNKKDVDDLLVSFKLDSGLVSSENLSNHNFGILPQGQESVVLLRVTAANNGLYYIHVSATLVTDKHQSRSFAIPINVGNVDVRKSLKTMGNVTTDSTGRRIITTPAEVK